ncbi:hypothetical protein EVAR_40113_1 [Eumeta japonica]|uniref:Uncharacterized protein n=1 Tax=Eumeta variegata TaxID=151549 RepID=A0A4C1WBN2_EUMVA|nr:hypothetical protein EVAR_40113_1 [Eumeta japonica]
MLAQKCCLFANPAGRADHIPHRRFKTLDVGYGESLLGYCSPEVKLLNAGIVLGPLDLIPSHLSGAGRLVSWSLFSAVKAQHSLRGRAEPPKFMCLVAARGLRPVILIEESRASEGCYVGRTKSGKDRSRESDADQIGGKSKKNQTLNTGNRRVGNKRCMVSEAREVGLSIDTQRLTLFLVVMAAPRAPSEQSASTKHATCLPIVVPVRVRCVEREFAADFGALKTQRRCRGGVVCDTAGAASRYLSDRGVVR